MTISNSNNEYSGSLPTPSEIPELAEACYEREALAGFIDGDILIEGERFSISPVEAATTEQVLRSLGEGDNVLVQASFPINSIPVALAVALTYEQEPRRGGMDLPVILFPRQDYVTTFDKLHYKHVVDPATGPEHEPIPRHPTASIAEIQNECGLRTANTQFTFNVNEYKENLATIVIDLRAPRWNDTYATQLERLLDAFPDVPVVYIGKTEDSGLGYELAEELSDVQVSLSPSYLEASPIAEVPVERRTPFSITEEILASGDVEYYYYAVGDEELAEIYPQFAAKKIELQERNIAPNAVGGLYNRLIQLPTKPEYWNKVSSSHGYFDSIPQQIEHLETIAKQYDSGESRIQNYITVARQLEAHLNDEHRLQNYLLNVIERAEESEESTRFVFSNDREQEAFLIAAEKAGYTLGTTDNVTFTTTGDLDPAQEVMTVFAGAPPRRSHHYEFPASERVVFMYFGILDEFITTRGKEQAGESVTHSEHTKGVAVDLDPVDIDQIEAEVEEIVAPVESDYSASKAASELLGGDPLWEVGGEEDDSEQSKETGSDDIEDGEETRQQRVRVFEFEEDYPSLTCSPLSKITLYHPERGEIERTRAQSVDVGDTVLLINGVADDLYDLVLDTAREREEVREDEELVEGWRDQLNAALESDEWTRKEFHKQLVEMGSDIADPASISQWRYGDIIAPGDNEDIRRVYQLARPGVDTSMFDQLASEVARAADRLRRRHQKIGKRIRSLVEYELDASTTGLPEYYDHEMQQRIREDAQRLTVARIEDRIQNPSAKEETGQASLDSFSGS